jgi:polysaccharide pyruvyl transferase CsaB
MPQKRPKIVICGHYGSTNLGDEAIGLGIIQTIKKFRNNVDLTVLSYDTERSDSFYRRFIPQLNVKTAYLLPLGFRSLIRGIFKGELFKTLRTIKDCDYFLLGGGGLFTDEKLYAIFLWGFQAFIARLYKKPVFMIGQSVGPLKRKLSQLIVKCIFNYAKEIHVRDSNSKKLLEKIGVNTKIILSTDAAFGMKLTKHNPNKKIAQDMHDEYFILSIRKWDKKTESVNKKIVQACNEVCKKYRMKAVFIPFQVVKENDATVLNKYLEQNSGKECFVLKNYTDDLHEIMRVISGARFTVGVRLHSLIFSIRSSVPFIGYSYSEKINNFTNMCDLNNNLIENISSAEIFIKIDKIISGERKIIEKIKNCDMRLVELWDGNMENFADKYL